MKFTSGAPAGVAGDGPPFSKTVRVRTEFSLSSLDFCKSCLHLCASDRLPTAGWTSWRIVLLSNSTRFGCCFLSTPLLTTLDCSSSVQRWNSSLAKTNSSLAKTNSPHPHESRCQYPGTSHFSRQNKSFNYSLMTVVLPAVPCRSKKYSIP